jgi:cytochrome P450
VAALGGNVDAQVTPPFYRSPARPVPFLAALPRVLSDPASIIPATIYDEWAVKLPGPLFPLVVAHPERVREVLLDDGTRFGRNRQLRALLRRAWGQGLAASEGERWARQRRAAAPAFRPAAVESAASAMAEATRQAAARWRDGEPIELGGLLGRVVTEVVLKTLFSAGEDTDFDAAARDIPRVLREVTTFGLVEAVPLPIRLLDRLRGFGRSPQEARLRRLAAAIAETPHDGENDLRAMLRGVGPPTDNTFGFMLAGFETTALGAAWAIYLLSLHPAWQDKLRQEAHEAGGRLDRLVLARQVAQETLRLYPPAPMLVRSAMKRTTLQGHRLWPGQAVLIPVFAIHRHRQLWDDPDSFDPGRFGADARHERGAYLPFGAGPRRCIAASFALAEITVIVSELARAFRFSPVGPPPDVSLRVSTYSRTGLHVAAHSVASDARSP